MHFGRTEARHFVGVLLFEITLAGLLPCPAHGDGVSAAEFKKWSKALGKRKGFDICRWGELTNPLTKETGFYAWFYGEDGKGGTIDDDEGADGFAFIAFAAGDKKWLYTPPGDALELRCDEPTERFERRERLSIHRADGMGQHNWEDRDVTIDAQRGPVLLRTQDGHNSGGADDTNEVDWKTLVATTEIHAGSDDGEYSLEAQGAVFPIPKNPSQGLGDLPPAKTWVTFGKKAWSGPSDASINVKVTAAEGKFRISISVTDDQHISVKPDADAAALLRGDHIEIWYDRPADNSRTTETQEHQFGFAIPENASDPVKPIWLFPPRTKGSPPARVMASDGKLMVELDMVALGVTDTSKLREIPFTVVFSDSDDPQAGQQTLVATSQLHRHDVASFGSIITGVENRLPPLEHVKKLTLELVRKLRHER
jgi:hypothetical protein